MQDDRKRIDKFHKTIETQESVIEQLEALLRAAAPSDDSRYLRHSCPPVSSC